ncbi:MAG: Rrf2 family transcriptional regulator [bacterium]
MRISARCDYGCRALLGLSLHWPSKKPLQIHTISERHNIPIKYLVQIMIQLKRVGLVDSVRGKRGGYILTRSPDEISLGEVVREIGGALLPLAPTVAKKDSVFATIWEETERSIADVLDKVTFGDIASRAKAKEGTISYQI